MTIVGWAAEAGNIEPYALAGVGYRSCEHRETDRRGTLDAGNARRAILLGWIDAGGCISPFVYFVFHRLKLPLGV